MSSSPISMFQKRSNPSTPKKGGSEEAGGDSPKRFKPDKSPSWCSSFFETAPDVAGMPLDAAGTAPDAAGTPLDAAGTPPGTPPRQFLGRGKFNSASSLGGGLLKKLSLQLPMQRQEYEIKKRPTKL